MIARRHVRVDDEAIVTVRRTPGSRYTYLDYDHVHPVHDLWTDASAEASRLAYVLRLALLTECARPRVHSMSADFPSRRFWYFACTHARVDRVLELLGELTRDDFAGTLDFIGEIAPHLVPRAEQAIDPDPDPGPETEEIPS